MNKKKFLFSMVISFCMFLMAVMNFQTNISAATSGQYALKVGGENTDNVNIDNGSYMITGDPGQTVEVKLLIINKSSDARKFEYNVNTAYTTNDGGLGYDKRKVTDSALKIQTGNLADPNHAVIKIPGTTTATVTAKITIPKKKYTGYLMGGFNVRPYKEKAKGTVASNGTLIKNKFSYSVPIQIHQKSSENAEPKYSITSVKPGIQNLGQKKHGAVYANIHNASNSYSGQLDSKAVVTKKGDKSFKITETKNGQNIAPTSNYNYMISWGNKNLQSGNYHLKLTYKTSGGLKSWILEKDFSITNNDAAKYNKLAGIKPNYLWLWILLGVLALAIILGLGIYLGKRNNNNNNNGNSGNTTRRRRR
ncbi:DUF3324 domain-containing protein [Companilactobacillus futsaii]|nr:DUF3324 domain-containing protein [Companilactobacillus futsaii]